MKAKMLQCTLFGLFLVVVSGCSTLIDKEKIITVKPQALDIVLPDQSDVVKQFAAQELQKHLKMITGVAPDIVTKGQVTSGHYPVYVGITPKGDSTSLKPEEARWQVLPNATYIYGADLVRYDKKGAKDAVFNQRLNQTGTLFAVYDFLENELGVRWIEPGDGGIVFTPQNPLQLKEGQGDWVPKFVQREIRTGMNRKYLKSTDQSVPEAYRLTSKQKYQYNDDVRLWLKRMRMGRSLVLNYGHAFTRWWDKYGKSNPDFFALTEEGKRIPYAHGRRPGRIKMCVSNPAVHQEVVNNWLKDKKSNDSWRSETINVCENDSAGYCLCKTCMALDAPKDGEKFPSHLSDRYIYFANKILEKAQKHDPNVKTVMYAYSYYKEPPRREKVKDGVVIGFVPALLTPDKKLRKMYADWQSAGARELFLRPNDFHIDTGLPMGFEKKLFDNFKIGYEKGIIGTDYDSLHNFWRTSGIANYILAKAHIDPDKSFDYWENEYCNTFGPAKDDIKKYYHYWRSLWDERFVPSKDKIMAKGRYGNFRRGLMWDLFKYYNEDDFNKTDAFLRDALSKALTPAEKRRVENLIKGNTHARLMYLAMKAKYDPSEKGKAKERLKHIQSLLAFRKVNKEDLNLNLTKYFKIEKEFGDVCSTAWAALFEECQPVKPLPTYWKFKLDPGNVGLKDSWQNIPMKEIKQSWQQIRTDRFWEKQPVKINERLRNQLKDYNGIGWYATKIWVPKELKGKSLYLTFGAVDESCWVYVDGKEVGKHLFSKPDDWKTPFAINISSAIKPGKVAYDVVVRVEDKSGAGGIWRPVWLAVGKSD